MSSVTLPVSPSFLVSLRLRPKTNRAISLEIKYKARLLICILLREPHLLQLPLEAWSMDQLV
jgi:hypothetical protein